MVLVAYTNFLLCRNPRQYRAILCPNTFEFLGSKLSQLDHGPVSQGLSIYKKLAIFLYIFGQGTSNRQTHAQFHHSGKKNLLSLPPFAISPHSLAASWWHWMVCMCKPSYLKQWLHYRNHKDTLSHKNLGVVNFLIHACLMDFKILISSFYLANARYPLSHSLIFSDLRINIFFCNADMMMIYVCQAIKHKKLWGLVNASPSYQKNWNTPFKFKYISSLLWQW
ncbi:hypothetical protein VP01_496g13 [Puccinia sorghi]|uniref:DUF8040 domain-containing protein n=1 Tax=Puccinia sorghi TaxID=27349 RepID=A0A0L6ULW8_9BASI|nr:hypothetical protein VP01_496g13 [Puccinia sorghi]